MFYFVIFLFAAFTGFSLFGWTRLNGVDSLPLSKPMAARVKDTLEITRFYNIQQCDQQSSLYNPHTDQWNLGMFCLFACFYLILLSLEWLKIPSVLTYVLGAQKYHSFEYPH